jgi:hypothetical protein
MNLQDLAQWSQVLSSVAIVGTFIIYYFLLLAARRASEAQNLLTTITYLQQPHVRAARGSLLNLLDRKTDMPKPLADWQEEDRAAAATAISGYDAVAILCRRNIVPVDVIVENWGNSILRCRKAAQPLLDEYRKPEHYGAAYWDDFEWLYTKARNSPTWQTPGDLSM